MSEQSTVPQEQAQPGTPPQEQQAAVQPAQETPPANEQPTAEQVAQWRTQAEQAQAYQVQLAQQQEQYRSLQGEFTRRSQALAQLTGAQPNQQQQDPLSPYVQQLTQKGYDSKQARDLAETMYGMVQPLAQQNQQLQHQLQGVSQVDNIMRAAYESNPAVFANQQVWDTTKNTLLQLSAAGGQIDAQQAEYTAVIAAHEAAKAASRQPGLPQYPQQQPIPQPFASGQFRVTPNFQPPQPPAVRQLSPEQQSAEAELKTRYNLK